MPRPTRSPDLDPAPLDTLAASVIAAARSEGSLPLAKLASHGVPKPSRSAILERCALAGLEVTARVLRVPLADQLRAQLSDGASLPLRTLANAVRGGTKKEATDAAHALVRAGEAALVLRGTEVTLLPASAHVIQRTDFAALEAGLASLQKTLKAARKARASLLASDLDESLARLRPAPRAVTVDAVVTQVRALVGEIGLTFVPAVVRALGGAPQTGAVHEALRSAARRGLVELRPESGLGRLTQEELAFCVPGPQGSRLSWARIVEPS